MLAFLAKNKLLIIFIMITRERKIKQKQLNEMFTMLIAAYQQPGDILIYLNIVTISDTVAAVGSQLG